MTTLALIQKSSTSDGTDAWIPSVLSEIRPGDTYKLIIDGVPQEQILKALANPKAIVESGLVIGWNIEHEVLTDLSAK